MQEVDGTSQVSIEIIILDALVMSVLHKQGVEASEAREILDVLMYAELRGNNQGLVKVPLRGVLPRPDAQAIEIKRPATSVAHINAHGSAGIITTLAAAREAAKIATEHGIGVVGIHNLSSSTSAIGYYAEYLAKSGLIGIIMSGSPKAMAPEGGTKPVFGTNPIAISAPTSGVPITFDMSTASIAWYGVVQAMQRGEALPEGLAYDSAGEPTSEPADALQGAIKAFAGHKGSGLALMIEILTGPLLGNALAGDPDVSSNWGNMILAIDPAKFGDQNAFLHNVDRLAALVKGSAQDGDATAVLLPGERGNLETAENFAKGTVTIDRSLFEQLNAIANDQDA